MAIKPDHWIRRMALEHGMIDPFVEKQVREGGISFGVSSYGYDIRLGYEFKVFTNVHNTVVDPKNFDDLSFVNFEGETCTIPPNSFLLSRTIEHFKIPRNVLSICLGKSTYARCFSGNTRVALVDGTAPTLEEMAIRADSGEMFWGYSIGPHGRIIVSLLESPRFIGRDSLLEITLDNGETIQCTSDHEFILRDGLSTPAHKLRIGLSLMPLYRQLIRGYEGIYQPINGHILPTHRLADEWNLRHEIYEDIPNTHRHHIDHNRRNNAPWNIERMNASEHIRHHNNETYGEDFDPEAHSLAIKETLTELRKDPEWYANYVAVQSQRAKAFWHDEQYIERRRQLIEWRLQNWTEERKQAASERMKIYYSDPANRDLMAQISKNAWSRDDGQRREQQKEIARRLNIREEITAETVRQALDQTGSIRGAARVLECDRAVFRRFPDVIRAFKGMQPRNHKVTAIREIPGDHDVYCLTVPEAGNFALEAGVFVHNCGLIVNVTPLEPEWEGYLTLEISNTTPLPARIYGGEGIAQLLFFESDEMCETSYADRKGKYQNQVEVTLPRL